MDFLFRCTIMYRTMLIRGYNKGTVSILVCIYVHYPRYSAAPRGVRGAGAECWETQVTCDNLSCFSYKSVSTQPFLLTDINFAPTAGIKDYY